MLQKALALSDNRRSL